MSLLARLFGLQPTQTVRVTPQSAKLRKLSLATAPAATYAVGDVHGHLDLYRALEDRILADAQAFDGPILIVLLGDMIDRGAQSAQLVDHLLSPAPERVTRVCLRGNHEDMFAQFLKSPANNRDWLNWGGAETLASYGILPENGGAYELTPDQWARKLDAAIAPKHRRFYEQLPLSLSLPEWYFAHAGINPARAIKAQTKRDVLWSDPHQMGTQPFEKLIVHGHVPVDSPQISDVAANLDTGAYETGRLTAARFIEGQEICLLEAGKDT